METMLGKLIDTFSTNGPIAVQYVLMGLGSLVILGGIYVKATPGKEDDAWFDKLENHFIIGALFRVLIRFSPIQRKEVPPPTENK